MTHTPVLRSTPPHVGRDASTLYFVRKHLCTGGAEGRLDACQCGEWMVILHHNMHACDQRSLLALTALVVHAALAKVEDAGRLHDHSKHGLARRAAKARHVAGGMQGPV